jgi:hypothetical protein
VAELTPEAGARFSLEREAIDADGEGARYKGGIHLPDASYAYGLALKSDGSALLEGGGRCAEHEERLVDLAKSLARGAARRREEGLAMWPERQVRWRGPGRG